MQAAIGIGQGNIFVICEWVVTGGKIFFLLSESNLDTSASRTWSLLLDRWLKLSDIVKCRVWLIFLTWITRMTADKTGEI